MTCAEIMANIGIAVLLILFIAVTAGSIYLNLFCANLNKKEKMIENPEEERKNEVLQEID